LKDATKIRRLGEGPWADYRVKGSEDSCEVVEEATDELQAVAEANDLVVHRVRPQELSGRIRRKRRTAHGKRK
jgi:hypothetical protein